MPEAMLSHLGICVTDVDRSRRFYCELFGFKETYSRVVNDDRFARLMQSPKWNVEVVMLTLGDRRLADVTAPDTTTSPDPEASGQAARHSACSPEACRSWIIRPVR